MRKHLKHVFDPKGQDPEGQAPKGQATRPGLHHWSTQRWFEETQQFLSVDLSLESSDRNVWALVLLLYPAFGPSKKFEAHIDIKSNLGDEGILIYKEIFDKNREGTRNKFLKD
jgi:hypothetical protein